MRNHWQPRWMLLRGAFVGGLWLIVAALLAAGPAHAQPGRVEVFLGQDPDTGITRIFFMDPLSGLSTLVTAENGQHFTLLGDYVLYEKAQTGAVMRANASGTLEQHPFIRRLVDTRSLRWVTSPDGRAVAWVRVNTAGVSEVYVAWADGDDLRQLPISTPASGLELFPLALTNDRTFFYDAAHTPASTPYDQFAHVAAYSVEQETFFSLPDEPNCPCGAAITPDGRIFARLEGAQGPFALHVWDLPTGADIRIPPPNQPFRVGGDLLLNETGTLAAYSVAAGVGPEAGMVLEQYAMIVVDVVAQRQIVALAPGAARYRPVAFIDGDSALLLAGVSQPGTYKLDLTSDNLWHVSDETYLGAITTG